MQTEETTQKLKKVEMKNAEQKITPTQKTVLDFLSKFSDTTAEIIVSGTGLNKLIVFKSVKALADKSLIKITFEDDTPIYHYITPEGNTTYAHVKTSAKTADNGEEKNTNVSGKKSTKTETTKKADEAPLPKTDGRKKEIVLKENDEVKLPKTGGRDTSKFRFNSETYSKSRLVHAIIAKYVLDNPKTTLAALQEVFKSQELQKRYGTVVEISKAKRFCEGGRDRHFMKAPIKLGGDKKVVVVVSNQWSSELLAPFLKIAKGLNYQIKQLP